MTRVSYKPLVERAYEMARSGRFTGIREIRVGLRAEKYSALEIDTHLRGAALRDALTKLCDNRGMAT